MAWRTEDRAGRTSYLHSATYALILGDDAEVCSRLRRPRCRRSRRHAEMARGPGRPYPSIGLREALAIPYGLRDHNAGHPMNRILLAEALGTSPSSTLCMKPY